MVRKTADSTRVWQLNSAALAALGWLALIWLLSTPSEQAASLLFGYSARRLALAAILLTPCLLLTWAAIKWAWFAPWVGRLQAHIQKLKSPFALLLAFALIAALSLGGLLLPSPRAIDLFGPFSLYLEQFRPLLLFTGGFGLLAFGLTLAAHYGVNRNAVKDGDALRLAAFIFGGLLLGAAAVALNGVGLGYDATVWNAPGTPLLITQVVISAAAAAALLWALGRLRSGRGGWRRLDLALAILVWIVAAAMWLYQPAEPTYYSSAPRPPNFESYPVSDAFNHDAIAQNVLIGQGFHFGGLVAIRRPLYVMLLAGLEGLLNSNYAAVVNAQVVVLALFPTFLYLLGTRLHSRFSGLVLAGLVIFRETNSIALGHVINASHAKLLMADLPTALAMAALGLAAVAWLRGSPGNYLAALGAGGLLGAFVLLRSQTLTLIPAFLLLALLVWGWRAGWRPALLFVLAVGLVAAPWVVRNRIGMGQWAIEDSIVSGFLANRYRYEPGTFGLPFLQGETEGEYYARQMSAVRQFAFDDPLYVAGFVADNFVRNQLLNFMALPVSFQLRDLESHARQLPYWPGWDGALPAESYLPVALNLGLVSLGVAAAWKRLRWVGLAPLFMDLGFTLNLALARVSGWRYNLPIDWVMLLYFALGLGQLGLWGLLLFSKKQSKHEVLFAQEQKPTNQRNSTQVLVAACLALLLIGSSFSIIEAISRPKFQKMDAQVVLQLLRTQPQTESLRTLENLLTERGLDIVNGRALYPAFYSAGEGIVGSDFVLDAQRDFDRITFYLIGPENASVTLPFADRQTAFPSAAHAILLRCSSNSPNALAVVLPDQSTVLYSGQFEDGCQE